MSSVLSVCREEFFGSHQVIVFGATRDGVRMPTSQLSCAQVNRVS